MSDGSLKWNVRCNTIVVFAHRVPTRFPHTLLSPVCLYSLHLSSSFFNIHTTARTVREIENETFTYSKALLADNRVGMKKRKEEEEEEEKKKKKKKKRRRRRREKGKKGRPNHDPHLRARGNSNSPVKIQG